MYIFSPVFFFSSNLLCFARNMVFWPIELKAHRIELPSQIACSSSESGMVGISLKKRERALCCHMSIIVYSSHVDSITCKMPCQP